MNIPEDMRQNYSAKDIATMQRKPDGPTQPPEGGSGGGSGGPESPGDSGGPGARSPFAKFR
jgi:hypothetical protein